MKQIAFNLRESSLRRQRTCKMPLSERTVITRPFLSFSVLSFSHEPAVQIVAPIVFSCSICCGSTITMPFPAIFSLCASSTSFGISASP